MVATTKIRDENVDSIATVFTKYQRSYIASSANETSFIVALLVASNSDLVPEDVAAVTVSITVLA